MHGKEEGMCDKGDMNGGRGCVWQGCVCGNGEGACASERQQLKRAVRILLECILVFLYFPQNGIRKFIGWRGIQHFTM